MPDKYDTYTEPIPAIYETDITQNLCVKVEKIKDLHKILSNDKGGRFYADLLKLSHKLHKHKLQKICRFVLHYFQAIARPTYFRGLCQVSACFYHTVWRISNGKSGTFAYQVFVAL